MISMQIPLNLRSFSHQIENHLNSSAIPLCLIIPSAAKYVALVTAAITTIADIVDTLVLIAIALPTLVKG